MEWKHTDTSVKKKILVKQSIKKIMLTVFWDMKRLITIDFFDKGAIPEAKFTSFIELSL